MLSTALALRWSSVFLCADWIAIRIPVRVLPPIDSSARDASRRRWQRALVVHAKVNRSGDADDRGDDAPMVCEINISEAERRVGVGREIDGVVSMGNQAQKEKSVCPECEPRNVQRQHQKDGPTEQEHCRHKTRPPVAKTPQSCVYATQASRGFQRHASSTTITRVDSSNGNEPPSVCIHPESWPGVPAKSSFTFPCFPLSTTPSYFFGGVGALIQFFQLLLHHHLLLLLR